MNMHGPWLEHLSILRRQRGLIRTWNANPFNSHLWLRAWDKGESSMSICSKSGLYTELLQVILRLEAQSATLELDWCQVRPMSQVRQSGSGINVLRHQGLTCWRWVESRQINKRNILCSVSRPSCQNLSPSTIWTQTPKLEWHPSSRQCKWASPPTPELKTKSQLTL